MKYIYDHDLHIHSQISVCSNHPGQTAECILNYALENGLKKICVTDHFWDDAVPGASDWYKKQNYQWIERILPLPKSDKVEFLFGAETEMDKHLTIGMGKECTLECFMINFIYSHAGKEIKTVNIFLIKRKIKILFGSFHIKHSFKKVS